MEHWKKVKKCYSVSDNGNIRNDKTGRILKPYISSNGYCQVMLGGKTSPQYVHRLVATAFIENPDNKPQVDHIDGNKANNKVDNLRWVTAYENHIGYGFEQGNRNRQKKIKATNANGDTLVFESRISAAEYFKCHKSGIDYGRTFKKGNKKGWIFELVI